eukprot:GHVR01088446.1.p1 GENE.GHVR01088446.1~~GHVR01088446.1.p1  ORF type:complete len:340 (+),score=94.46 GHVR01088446.1:2-1021(+)
MSASNVTIKALKGPIKIDGMLKVLKDGITRSPKTPVQILYTQTEADKSCSELADEFDEKTSESVKTTRDIQLQASFYTQDEKNSETDDLKDKLFALLLPITKSLVWDVTGYGECDEAICNDEFKSFNQWKGTISITTRFPTQNQNLFDPKKQVLGVSSFSVGKDADGLIEVPIKKAAIDSSGASPGNEPPAGTSPDDPAPTGGAPNASAPTGGSPTTGDSTASAPNSGTPTAGTPTAGTPTAGTPNAGAPGAASGAPNKPNDNSGNKNSGGNDINGNDITGVGNKSTPDSKNDDNSMIFGLSTTVVIIIGVVIAVFLFLILSFLLCKKKTTAPQEYLLS